jgi:hypothetical protein
MLLHVVLGYPVFFIDGTRFEHCQSFLKINNFELIQAIALFKLLFVLVTPCFKHLNIIIY